MNLTHCGILESRIGCTEEKAWELAETFENEVANFGKITNKDAKFIVRGGDRAVGDETRQQDFGSFGKSD